MTTSSRLGIDRSSGDATQKLTRKIAPKAVALSFRKKRKKAFQIGADGMKVEGPSHERGGVEARTPNGKPVAEIEGGERIFSQEDTEYLEQAAKSIVRTLQSNPQAANTAAQALGFKVVEMIVEQEKNQREQEGDEDTQDVDQAGDALNQFSNAGEDEGGMGI